MKKLPIIELCLSIVSIWWAFVLANNDHMFDNIPVLFRPFEKIMDESGWAFVFIVAAGTKVVGILFNRFWLRKWGLILSMSLYGLITAGFILSSEPISTGTGTYFALCVLAAWALREVRMDARTCSSIGREN